jgi:hypothetical protein
MIASAAMSAADVRFRKALSLLACLVKNAFGLSTNMN